MCPQALYGIAVQVGGVSIQKTVIREADHPNTYEVSLPVGTAGTLSTRTDNDTGVVTVAALPAHGITTSDKVDVYWSGGVRYGMSVTAQTSTTISIDLGAGDNLPIATTAVVITKQVSIGTAIDGDNAKLIAISAEYASPSSTAVAHVDMQDSGGSSIEEIDLTANSPLVYDIAGGATNVFTGNPIASTKASNGSATETCTLKIVSLEDSTP